MKHRLEHLADDPKSGREFALLQIPAFRAWHKVERPSPAQWCCFLSHGASSLDAESAGSCAGAMLNQGLVYLYAWGTQARSLEDRFDTIIMANRIDEERGTILTASNEDSSLDSALEDFTTSAWPAAEFSSSCNLWLCVVVGDPDLAERVRLFFRSERGH